MCARAPCLMLRHVFYWMASRDVYCTCKHTCGLAHSTDHITQTASDESYESNAPLPRFSTTVLLFAHKGFSTCQYIQVKIKYFLNYSKLFHFMGLACSPNRSEKLYERNKLKWIINLLKTGGNYTYHLL
jgi:hypothetical protein